MMGDVMAAIESKEGLTLGTFETTLDKTYSPMGVLVDCQTFYMYEILISHENCIGRSHPRSIHNKQNTLMFKRIKASTCRKFFSLCNLC